MVSSEKTRVVATGNVLKDINAAKYDCIMRCRLARVSDLVVFMPATTTSVKSSSWGKLIVRKALNLTICIKLHLKFP